MNVNLPKVLSGVDPAHMCHYSESYHNETAFSKTSTHNEYDRSVCREAYKFVAIYLIVFKFAVVPNPSKPLGVLYMIIER